MNETPATPSTQPYEPPAVLEDLPLEAYSLACDKAPGPCEDFGGAGTS